MEEQKSQPTEGDMKKQPASKGEMAAATMTRKQRKRNKQQQEAASQIMIDPS